MFWHKREDNSYVAVALTFIMLGAGVFSFGLVGWLVNTAAEQTMIAFPSVKVIGGLIVMCLGYIQLELGLLRKK